MLHAFLLLISEIACSPPSQFILYITGKLITLNNFSTCTLWDIKLNKVVQFKKGKQKNQLYIMQNTMKIPQNIKNKITIWSSSSCSRYLSKDYKNSNQKDICVIVFITLFTIVKTWKQPTWQLTDEWINTIWCMYIYKMEYYAAIKRWNIAICDINECWHYFAKWNKLKGKG